MEKKAVEKKYAGGGVILILNAKDKSKEYIVLPKRSNDAPINPGAHSGFFGGVDIEKEEENYPDLISIRELHEELLITSRGREIFYELKFPNHDFDLISEETKKLRCLWNNDKEADIKEKCIPILGEILDSIEYIESGGRKRILMAKFDIPSLDEIRLFDGETKEDHPVKGLLDRQIDVFYFRDFKEWWFNRSTPALLSEVSFKSGKKVSKGFIINENNKISPSFILALNKSKFFPDY